MKRLVLVTAMLAACGGGGKSDPVARMKGFADQMCACQQDKDPVGCAVKVNVAFEKWEQGLDEKSVTDEMEAKMELVDNDFSRCRREINGE